MFITWIFNVTLEAYFCLLNSIKFNYYGQNWAPLMHFLHALQDSDGGLGHLVSWRRFQVIIITPGFAS